MGLLFSLKGADFSSGASEWLTPVQRGAEFFNFFGGRLERLSLNLIKDKPSGQLIGSPVVSAAYATFRGAAAHVLTPVLDQPAVTLLAVTRAPNLQAATFGMIIASFAGSLAAEGSNMMVNSSSRRMTARGARDVNNTPASVDRDIASDTAVWRFFAVRMGPNYHRIDDKTAGTSALGPVVWPRSAPNGLPYRIGAANNTLQGIVDIACAGIHSAELTDDEIDAYYKRIKLYYATKGIVI